MWLGELITERGIGNGISFIIFAGIVGRVPERDQRLRPEPEPRRSSSLRGHRHRVGRGDHLHPGRPAPDPHPVRQPGPRPADVLGWQTFLPLRVNQAGVIPIIFAVSILLFPQPDRAVLHDLPDRRSSGTSRAASSTSSTERRSIYIVLYFLLTVGFTYFYTAFTFKPDETAEQLRKNGGFIPGIRPGRPTQDYLARVVTRITIAGALFLGIVAVVPTIVGVHPAAAGARPRRHEHPHRRGRRRRDDEAARGAAPDAQLRGLHPVTRASGATGRR